MENFSIFGQIQKELDDFRTKQVHIAGTETAEEARYLRKQERGYFFSQRDTLNLIDLYYNSKYETGPLDSEGQRKLFLNICAFRSDVASKMVDIDTKNFVFIPDGEGDKWGTYFIQKEFKDWVRKTYFGEFINDLVENYPRYGSLVVKRVGKKVERVPLRNLVNQQDAKDLQCATHVIELHDNMTLSEMQEYPDWNTTGLTLKFGEGAMVYERYGAVPSEWYYAQKSQTMPESEAGKSYDCMAVATIDVKKKKTENASGTLLYLERVKERPYLECHWKKQEGRWLGIGEVENQFENQISRNMLANLRRRSLLWASKKVFQSPSDEINKNLVKDVKDGDILKITPSGEIKRVDTTSGATAEFASAEDVWEKNSDQKSFTYEVATGESMPSGTPFRMGVILSNAVNSHFGLKKEKLGLFLKKIVLEDVFEIFKKENSRAHTITIFGNEKGINDLRKIYSEIEYNKRITEWALGDSLTTPNFDQLKGDIEQGYAEKTHLFIDIPDNYYDEIKHRLELVITGEEIDLEAEIATWTTIYQSLAQSGDPRAEQALNHIASLTGKNLEAVLGPKPAPAPMPVANKDAAAPSSMPTLPQPNTTPAL